MPELLLGPLLRYVDEDTATVWVETDRPCRAEIACGDPAGAAAATDRNGGGSARTWQVHGHHYALVTVTGLEPGTTTPYRVLLDGEQAWPPPDGRTPAGAIRTRRADGREPLRVAFGSCRWAARPADSHHATVGPDALEALAGHVRAGGEAPHALLLLGDQVYADETSPRLRRRLARRRDMSKPPWSQVADYEEYTQLYYESWLAPKVRWLLSTIPTCMIFDDHDVIDDWNTSEAWRRDIRDRPWWRERLLGGLSSYWVYQHLGNMSPAELASDPLFAAVRAASDGADVLREWVERADRDPASFRWSYRRDFGPVRLVMADTRAGRVLEERERSMLDKGEWDWLREQVLEPGCDHLLVGSSLPWLLPPAIHDTETWNAALCAGARGSRLARFGEKLRRAADLEHWAAFTASFRQLSELLATAGSAPDGPATVSVLSGDVHHAYLTEPRFAGSGFPVPHARVTQLTCSPMHNSIPASMRWGFRFGWSRPGRLLGRALARHARLPKRVLDWRRTGGPWFGNHLMTLVLDGRAARLVLDRADEGTRTARSSSDGPPASVLTRVVTRELAASDGAADSGPADTPAAAPPAR